MELCPCGSEKKYDHCCQPYHQGDAKPSTAQELMQARYSAFVTNNIQFIADTHVPETTDFDIDEAREWATKSTWKGLEIVATAQGQEGDDTGVVEFKALYADDKGTDYIHHEVSKFRRVEGDWRYEDGQLVATGGTVKREGPKVGRNDPCICGSGKKYKKCCGK